MYDVSNTPKNAQTNSILASAAAVCVSVCVLKSLAVNQTAAGYNVSHSQYPRLKITSLCFQVRCEHLV